MTEKLSKYHIPFYKVDTSKSFDLTQMSVEAYPTPGPHRYRENDGKLFNSIKRAFYNNGLHT